MYNKGIFLLKKRFIIKKSFIKKDFLIYVKIVNFYLKKHPH